MDFKTGDRVWLYYVNEEVILESKSIKDKGGQERIDQIAKVTKDMSKGIYAGAVDVPQNLLKILENRYDIHISRTLHKNLRTRSIERVLNFLKPG